MRARRLIQTHDVLVATTRPNLNAVALLPEQYNAEVCSTGFCVLRAGEELEPEYLFQFVQSRAFIEPLVDLTKGALYPAVTDKQVFSQLVPWISRVEQRQIAARLKAQLAEVETARQAARAQVREVTNLTNAVFRHSVDYSAATTVRLGDVIRIDARIVDPTRPEFSVLPHISAENICSMTGELRCVKSAAEDGMESGKYLFDAGDVLYSKLRPYLRKATAVDFGGLCSADMYPIKFDESRVDASYLRTLLISDEFTSYANEMSARSRMPKLNREQLFAYEFDLPAIEEQRRIVARLKSQLAEVAAIQEAAAAQLAEIERLPQRILAQAFNSQGISS